jgi:hypothetical protein
MQKPKSINELLRIGGPRLRALAARLNDRDVALKHVCAALPPKLAETVVSAGFERGQLTVGVAAAAWAARLRYSSETLRLKVGSAMGVSIHRVRIRVLPPNG